jgi:pimeloyl-ACP methyl ester carboxylesterase
MSGPHPGLPDPTPMTPSSSHSSQPPPPAVALVPGFFGFAHRGDSTYFADRFVAGLRSVLEARGLLGIPVLAVSTLAIGSLRRRQDDLLRELRALETPTQKSPGLGGPRTWHLVGHSTGGLDAALLLRDAPLAEDGGGGAAFAEGGWGAWRDLVERVSSVTTIAAPHFGTGLADSPLAEFTEGHPSVLALRDMALATLDIARRGDLPSRIRFALSATPGLTKMPFFLVRMLMMNDLARDLRPDVAGVLSARPIRASAEGRVFSVATVAPRPGTGHPDKLFRDLWRWTHDGTTTHAPPRMSPPPTPSTSLDDLALRLPSQRDVVLSPIDAGDNDGVVTTQRQVLGQPIALVVGDHLDVLGRYRRVSLVDGRMIDPGLLTSGAEFGDDEFFGLLLRIGDRIAPLVSSAR